jgi:FtsP/CotA-like multicopper oxidase with cupredoxin domain
VVVGLTGVAAWLWSRTQQTNVGELSFANPLKIPPLLEPRIDADGRKVFDLRLEAGTSELLPGKTTQTWGANGSYLGPTLRASNGDRVAINVTNELPRADQHPLAWHAPAARGRRRSPPDGQSWRHLVSELGPSISRLPRSGITSTSMASLRTTSTEASPECSCSTILRPVRCPYPIGTGWMTSRCYLLARP